MVAPEAAVEGDADGLSAVVEDEWGGEGDEAADFSSGGIGAPPEDASVGVDEESVARDRGSLWAKLKALRKRFGDQEIMIERYIEGREFNVSVIASPEGPLVLPPAEMVFDSYGEGKERVVGYRAKWDTTSFEYRHTLRRFKFGSEDEPLLERVRKTAQRCFELFRLRGYARVDMRVDAEGRAQVIEVNANPCLSPDGGFAAAVERAGISSARMVKMILEDAVWPKA